MLGRCQQQNAVICQRPGVQQDTVPGQAVKKPFLQGVQNPAASRCAGGQRKQEPGVNQLRDAGGVKPG